MRCTYIYIYTVHIHIYVNRIYYLKVYTYDTHYSCHFHQWWNQNPFVNIFLSNFVVEINTVWHGLTKPLDWQDSSVIYLLQFQIDICSSSAKVLRDSTLSAVESPDKDWRNLQICNTFLALWMLINISSCGISSISYFDGFICLLAKKSFKCQCYICMRKGGLFALEYSRNPSNQLMSWLCARGQCFDL